MTSRVVVVGSLNLDLVVGLQRMPDPGETVFGHSLEQHAGGKGLNQAVAIARLGIPVTMVGALGGDGAADFLTDIVQREGIDSSCIAYVPGPSGTALIEVDANGANRIVVIPGSNDAVSVDHVRESMSSIDDIAVVLTQGEVPLPAIEAAMQMGREAGAITVLNPAPVRDYPATILAHVDYVIPNEHEAALLTGVPTSTKDESIMAAQALVNRGARCAIVTRGGEGCVWATADASGERGAFSITPVDTVAAGDAFCGGLVAALAEGQQIEEALAWASAAGALAATKPGAVPSLPTRAELDQMVRMQAAGS